MKNKTNSNLRELYYEHLLAGNFTPSNPCLGLIFLSGYTESCTLFMNKQGLVLCYLPHSRIAYLEDFESFQFLTNFKHIVWQLPEQDNPLALQA